MKGRSKLLDGLHVIEGDGGVVLESFRSAAADFARQPSDCRRKRGHEHRVEYGNRLRAAQDQDRPALVGTTELVRPDLAAGSDRDVGDQTFTEASERNRRGPDSQARPARERRSAYRYGSTER
jgi:hypothetical protein